MDTNLFRRNIGRPNGLRFPGSVVAGLAIAGLASAMCTPALADSSPAATGAIQEKQRFYYPQGCVHNANRAICTFAFVNQGDAATLLASANQGYAELYAVQLIDDGHVPHVYDLSYYIDKFGNRQNQLFMSKGDSGIYVVEYPNVDPHVTSAQFQRQTLIVGPVAVNQPPPASPPVQGQTVYSNAPNQQPPVALPQPGTYPQQQAVYVQQQFPQQSYPQQAYPQQSYPQQSGAQMQQQLQYQAQQRQLQQLASQSESQNMLYLACMQQQSANATLCKAQYQVSSAQNKVSSVNNAATQTTNTVNQAADTVKQVSGMFGAIKDLLPKKTQPNDKDSNSTPSK